MEICFSVESPKIGNNRLQRKNMEKNLRKGEGRFIHSVFARRALTSIDDQCKKSSFARRASTSMTVRNHQKLSLGREHHCLQNISF
jgi:hypothetical protein